MASTLQQCPQSQVDNKRELKLLINGVELYCIIAGTGPCPLLCIPGSMSSSKPSFKAQLEYFGREDSGYTIIGFDPRGYGHSRHTTRNFQVTPEHHTVLDAKDGHAIMNTLGYDKYYVLGWCGGGTVAIHMAVLYPSSIQGLVLWSVRAFITQNDVQAMENARTMSKIHPTVGAMHEEVYGSLEIAKPIWSKVIDAFIETYKHASVRYKNGELYYEELCSIKCPTLILRGGKDRFITLSHAEYLNKHIQDSELHVLSEGHHHLQLDLPSSFNCKVEKFLVEKCKTSI